MPRGNVAPDKLVCCCGGCNRCKNRAWRRQIAEAARLGLPRPTGSGRGPKRGTAQAPRKHRPRRFVTLSPYNEPHTRGVVAGENQWSRIKSAARLAAFFARRRKRWAEESQAFHLRFVLNSEHAETSQNPQKYY